MTTTIQVISSSDTDSWPCPTGRDRLGHHRSVLELRRYVLLAYEHHGEWPLYVEPQRPATRMPDHDSRMRFVEAARERICDALRATMFSVPSDEQWGAVLSELADATVDALVVVEEMPDWLRDSHRAARNFGVYPANGATRRRVPADVAAEIVAADPDGYARIVE
jgi:hypothetical protein